MGASNYVHLDNVDLLSESALAIRIRYDGATHWIPKSCIADMDTYDVPSRGVSMSIP